MYSLLWVHVGLGHTRAMRYMYLSEDNFVHPTPIFSMLNFIFFTFACVVRLGRRPCQSVLCWALLLCSLAARPSPPFCFGAAAAFLLYLNCVVSSLISNNSRISVTLPTGRAVVTAECGAALQPTTWAIAWLTVSCLVCYIACGLLWL